MNKSNSHILKNIIIALVIYSCITVISSSYYLRLDLSEDKIYSLSPGSIEIVEKFDQPISIKLFFSESLKELPTNIRNHGYRLQKLLKEFSSHTQIELEFIDPKPDSTEEVEARKFGLEGIKLAHEIEGYLGLVIASANKQQILPYLDIEREEFLEYDIAEAFVRLKGSTKPKLAIYSSLPVKLDTFDPSQRFNHQQREWSFVSNLRNSFDVEFIDASKEVIPTEIKLILILHPKDLPTEFEYQLDQYLMKGGRLLVAIDPFSRIDLANQHQLMIQTGQMPSISSDFETFLSAWGIGYDPNKMIGDLNRATRMHFTNQSSEYPFFLSLKKNDFNQENPLTAQLNQLLFAEAGSFTLLSKSDELSVQTLIESTKRSGNLDTQMAAYMNPVEISQQLKIDDLKHKIALMLQGEFDSAFSSPPEVIGEDVNFKQKSSKSSAVVLISDVDFLHDSNAVDRIPFVNRVIVRPKNDNIALLVNAAELLGGNQSLISVRKSGHVNRPFLRVEMLEKHAQSKWKSKEEKVAKDLEEIQAKLKELQANQDQPSSEYFNASEQTEIKKIREEEVKLRLLRRQILENLSYDTKTLKSILLILNLSFIPTLVCLFCMILIWRRKKLSLRH